MVTTKRIICLANSRKLSGRCVAGKELKGGAWIRPVSGRETEEVSEYERQYEDGSDPKVLDIVDVPLLRPTPRTFQSENWLLDPETYWEKVGRATLSDVNPFVGDPSALWTNDSSSSSGENDRVKLAAANRMPRSLFLLRVSGLALNVFAPGEAFGNRKRRVQGEFSHRNVGYKLWVTDPIVEREYLSKSDGSYRIGQCFLTVSLGEAYNGYCYKLIAAVITRPAAGGSKS